MPRCQILRERSACFTNRKGHTSRNTDLEIHSTPQKCSKLKQTRASKPWRLRMVSVTRMYQMFSWSLCYHRVLPSHPACNHCPRTTHRHRLHKGSGAETSKHNHIKIKYGQSRSGAADKHTSIHSLGVNLYIVWIFPQHFIIFFLVFMT